ncbi:hypothetical protein INR49_021327, partial [Caranx melampygus]
MCCQSGGSHVETPSKVSGKRQEEVRRRRRRMRGGEEESSFSSRLSLPAACSQPDRLDRNT